MLAGSTTSEVPVLVVNIIFQRNGSRPAESLADIFTALKAATARIQPRQENRTPDKSTRMLYFI
jgi:hypothetical protein